MELRACISATSWVLRESRFLLPQTVEQKPEARARSWGPPPTQGGEMAAKCRC